MERRSLALLGVLAVLAAGCGENPLSPEAGVAIAGTWDARFQGTVQGQGASQIDSFVLELRQSGSSVTGTLRLSGLDLAVPVTGQIDGTTFSYSARAALAPGCEAVVRAETTVESAGARFSGSQTQSSCEGTAIGQVNATRR